jgi:hypothetical protein
VETAWNEKTWKTERELLRRYEDGSERNWVCRRELDGSDSESYLVVSLAAKCVASFDMHKSILYVSRPATNKKIYKFVS